MGIVLVLNLMSGASAVMGRRKVNPSSHFDLSFVSVRSSYGLPFSFICWVVSNYLVTMSGCSNEYYRSQLDTSNCVDLTIVVFYESVIDNYTVLRLLTYIFYGI